MKKTGIRTALIALALFAVLSSCTSTLAVDIEAEQYDAAGIGGVEGALPDEAREILGDITVRDALDYESFFEKIAAAAKDKLSELVSRGLRSSVLLLTVVLLCALAGTVCDGSVPDYIPLCGAAAVAVIAVGDARSFLGAGAETIYRLSDFSKVLLPALASAATASGAVTSGAAKYMASAMFIDLLITTSAKILMPLIWAYIAVIIANAALGGEALEAISKLLKWLCTSILTTLMLIFTAYLGISGIISGTADATVTRFAKNAISTALPVVGGIVSGAADTILAGAGMLRSTLGVFGMLAVAAVCLTPFLTLGVQYLLYKLTAGIAGALSDKRLGGLISGVGSAFGLVMGLVGSGMFMMFISLISSMKAVTG